MQDYESIERLKNRNKLLHSSPRHQVNLNQWKRAITDKWNEKHKEPREHDAAINSKVTLSSNSALLKGVDEVKQVLEGSFDEVRIVSEKEANTWQPQLDQQTGFSKKLLPDLVLISKLFEAKAKKFLFEAQKLPKTLAQTEKALFQIEAHWQELESVTSCEKSPLKLLQLLKSLILEMQEYLILLRRTVAQAIATQLQIQHHYNLARKAADYCQHRAQLDWQAGNENWARETLIRRKTYLDTASILKVTLEKLPSQLEAFKCHLFVLQSWLSLAIEMKDMLKVANSSASVQVSQALLWSRREFPYNTSSIMAELEYIDVLSILEKGNSRKPS